MKKLNLSFGLLLCPIAAVAGVGHDILEEGAPSDSNMPDWLMFLILLFVVLMVAGKIK